MPLTLVRIDDRLIHGQVVIGWGEYLHPDRIVLCSDEVASCDWEKDIYLGAVSEDIETNVLGVEECAQSLRENRFGDAKLFVLVESPKVLIELIDRGVEITRVNVGGMHFKEGKRCIVPFLYVDDQDVQWFKQLNDRAVALECQDVPTCRKLDLAKLLHLNEGE